MNERLAEADAAFKAGRTDEGVRLTEAMLEDEPRQPVQLYRNFVGVLFRHRRYEQVARWCRQGSEIHPKDSELRNVLGVALRRLGQLTEAREVLETALAQDPKNLALSQNLGNVLNDLKDGEAAAQVFTKLVRQSPANAELQRSLGRAFRFAGDLDKAEMRFRLAAKLKPDNIDAWLDLTSLVAERESPTEALALFDEALAANPGHDRLLESKVIMWRRTGRLREAEQHLLGLLDEYPDKAWVHYQLGGTITDYDRPRANEHLEAAIALDPANIDYKMSLAESLGRSRHGDESEHIERAYQLMRQILPAPNLSPSQLKVALEIVVRVGDYDAAELLGDFKTLGRTWAESGRHTALLSHLGRVREPEDRVELVRQHRIWGELVEDMAAKRPLTRSQVRRPNNGKIRIGFMSSDLRGHPVAYFALPLFEHLDRSRFEVFCYSFYQSEEDGLQKRITSWVDGFRWEKDIGDRDAAQMIADDQLDMLIELGGSTHMNKLAVMAWKPAPLQASWLGYPHSAGLKAIDHLILDPHVCPPNRELLIEEPLLMPSSWIAMGELAFPDRPVDPVPPQVRNGFFTFGTANNPYKYSREMVQTWARVTAAVPDARFLFVRPEGGCPSFRENMCAIFAGEGVPPERVLFEDVRGAHMPHYNRIDVSLDTFPQTGGTTTCESLWMGVPVVTLTGAAFFERLSHSILTNAGLGDLCARDLDEYVAVAVKLASDLDRRTKLRTELRAMLKASPLGQTKQFAADFYDMLEGAVKASRQKAKTPAAVA